MKEKIETYEIINKTALQLLGKGDFLAAQKLFRENAKKNPCFASLNNLGVFYINEGMELPNGKIRNAKKLGLKYLKLAESYLQSHLNLMAIGDVYLDTKEYEVAIDYYKRACALSNSYSDLNNLGVSLYMQSEYEEASMYFEKSLDCCNDSDYSDTYPAKSTLFSSYAFSLLQYDRIKCHLVLIKMINSEICHIEMDEFILAYLCGDYQLARSLIKKMFDSWKLDTLTLAMVFDCLFKLQKNDEAKEILQLQIESLEGYEYDISKEINYAKRAFTNQEYREKAIAEYRYIPPIMKQSYYISISK